MKNFKKLISLFVIAFVLSISITALAENGIDKKWFSQPDPNKLNWVKATDGSLQLDILGTDGAVNTMTFVPTGYNATIPKSMPKDLICEVDMKIPDAASTSEGWAGVYFRADLPQAGVGGYLIHINTDGMAILDGTSGNAVIGERMPCPGLVADKFAHVKVQLLGAKLGVWVNGENIFQKTNAAYEGGYLGVSTVSYKGNFRNFTYTFGNQKFDEFVVAGTQYTGKASGTVENPGPLYKEGGSSVAPTSSSKSGTTSISSSSSISSDSSISSESSVSSASSASSTPTTKGKNNNTLIIIIAIITGLIVIAGAGVTAWMMSKKKNEEVK